MNSLYTISKKAYKMLMSNMSYGLHFDPEFFLSLSPTNSM